MFDPRQTAIVAHPSAGDLVEPTRHILIIEVRQASKRDDENVLDEVLNIGWTPTEGPDPALDVLESVVVDPLEG
jgi:hypothetical protein